MSLGISVAQHRLRGIMAQRVRFTLSSRAKQSRRVAATRSRFAGKPCAMKPLPIIMGGRIVFIARQTKDIVAGIKLIGGSEHGMRIW